MPAKILNKLLIHPVDFDCNMACGYCYNGSFGKPVTESKRTISSDLLFKIFDEVGDYLESDKLMVIWHGGEPLLAGKVFFKRAMEIQLEAARGRFTFRNCVQTNGTLVDDEWINLFYEYKIAPSVSIDGPSILHNQVRTFLNNAGTYDKAINAYKMFNTKMRTGLLIVISKINVGQPEIMWQWILDQGIKSLDFLPCLEPEKYQNGCLKYTVTEKEITDFSIKIFNLWFQHADPTIKIRTFKDGIKGQLGGKVNVCSWKGGCLSHISLDPAGNIFPCGRYHCYPETSFGNLNLNSFAEIMDGEKTCNIHRQIADGQKECSECRWYPICNSGCPFLKYAINGHWGGKFVHCGSRQALFSHIRQQISV